MLGIVFPYHYSIPGDQDRLTPATRTQEHESPSLQIPSVICPVLTRYQYFTTLEEIRHRKQTQARDERQGHGITSSVVLNGVEENYENMQRMKLEEKLNQKPLQ